MLDSDAPSRPKNPARVANGRQAMRSRWGPQRWVKLADLDPVTRGIITAILDASANAKAAPASETPGAAMEASGASRRPSAA